MLEALGADARMRASRALVVGEGRLDDTTLQGKVAGELATRARQSGVPCHAIAGSAPLDLFGRRIIDLQSVQEAGERRGPRGRGRGAERVPIERAARTFTSMAERPQIPARSTPRRAVVVGAGSFGTAVAVLLARGGLRTTLQTRTPEQAALLQSARENAVYLPEVALPPELRIESADVGLARYDLVFLGVPSGGLDEVVAALPSRGLKARAAVVSLAKGLVPPDGHSRRPLCGSSTERSASPSSAARPTRARWSTRAPGSSRPPRTRSSRG